MTTEPQAADSGPPVTAAEWQEAVEVEWDRIGRTEPESELELETG